MKISGKIDVRLTYNEIQDLLSAVTFTQREYTKSTKDPAPNFRAALEKLRKKLWAASDKVTG